MICDRHRSILFIESNTERCDENHMLMPKSGDEKVFSLAGDEAWWLCRLANFDGC